MNHTIVAGILIGGAFASAGAAVAGLGLASRAPEYAEVIEVHPVRETRGSAREARREIVGYDVRYRLGELERVVRLDREPGRGERIPVEDGELVVSPPAGAALP